MNNSLSAFFEPRGVAIIGARRSPGFGYGIPLSLQSQGWGDRIYLVNPSGGTMHGMTVYRSIAEAPEPVDLAVVIVPAGSVPGVMEEIGVRGIRHVIIESAGFAETGDAGRSLQNEVAAISKKHGIRVIGPNCVGVVNTGNTFTTIEVLPESLKPGPVGIIAQSGVFGNCLLDSLHHYNLFISKAVTLGNRLDVNEAEVLDYFHRDDATRAIVMYLEGTADGKMFKETLDRVSRDKPVLILKSGRTRDGARAAQSHTGSMSGADEIYDSVFEQTGAIRAADLDELLDFARVFSTQPLPAGNRIGILTSSGSLGALAADAAAGSGLEIPALSEQTVREARVFSPAWMNVKNPLDAGPSGQNSRLLPLLIADPAVDMLLIITVIPFAVYSGFKALGIDAKAMFGNIREIRDAFPGKPVAVAAVGHREFVRDIVEISGPSVPVFTSPEAAARALAEMWRYKERIKRRRNR